MPILTVAQLLGNLSRAGFGWRDIRWRPALLFSAGAVLASLLGSRMFIALPPGPILRLIGVFLLIVAAIRHTRRGWGGGGFGGGAVDGQLIRWLPEKGFALLVEVLLAVSAISLIGAGR